MITMARNSRKLFAVESPYNGDVLGILSLHARPDQVNPPSPKGHESERASRLGFRRVTRFIEIPLWALSRNASHKPRSSRLCFVSVSPCVL